ncbi:hypothetical protein CAAN1_12S02586 [[Candida] anglica]|uniref:Uncharacterized protein n=1 Tax=[Candida] anglica TaxID=148631 RepID=A0ABP0EA07_9ASCO
MGFFESKKEGNINSGGPEQPPPPYTEEANPQQAPNYGPSNPQQPSNYGPNNPQYPSNSGPNSYNNNSYNNTNSNYDPMQDPNVYKVPPQMVNITQANPQHLNPSYPQFLQREQDRHKYGATEPPPPKHGAPLSQGHKNPNSKTGGGSFPGSSGVTYNNAANR